MLTAQQVDQLSNLIQQMAELPNTQGESLSASQLAQQAQTILLDAQKSTVTLPKHTQKRIYWQEGKGRAFILVGYCPDTLGYFQAMYEEARKTFPDLNAKDATCGKVTRSRDIKGFTLLTFPVPGEKRAYDGWDNYSCFHDFNY